MSRRRDAWTGTGDPARMLRTVSNRLLSGSISLHLATIAVCATWLVVGAAVDPAPAHADVTDDPFAATLPAPSPELIDRPADRDWYRIPSSLSPHVNSFATVKVYAVD